MRSFKTLVLVALAICLVGGTAWSEDRVIGSVKIVKGDASIVRGGKTLSVSLGQRLQQGDILRTGSDGGLGIVLRDDTVISLGPDSEVTLDTFIFDPADNNMALVTKITRGAAVYLSGKIGKLAPEKVRFQTPSATIGIRGTKFAVKVD